MDDEPILHRDDVRVAPTTENRSVSLRGFTDLEAALTEARARFDQDNPELADTWVRTGYRWQQSSGTLDAWFMPGAPT